VMMYTKYVLVMRIFYCSTDVLSVIASADRRACARGVEYGNLPLFFPLPYHPLLVEDPRPVPAVKRRVNEV